MNPSSLRTWAMAFLRPLAGISTTDRSMRLALRMRVNMSAMGSVIMAYVSSPARLLDARNQAIAGHLAEADPADTELPINGAWPAANLAAEPQSDSLAWRHFCLVRSFPAGLNTSQQLLELHKLRFGGHRFAFISP